MTLKAAAHSHASQFSIYDLSNDFSSLVVNSSGQQLIQMNSFKTFLTYMGG